MLGADLETRTRSLEGGRVLRLLGAGIGLGFPPRARILPGVAPIVSAYQLLGEIPHAVTHSGGSCVLCRAVAGIIIRE